MNKTEKMRLSQYAERWKSAGVRLAEIKRQELRSFNYAANWELIDEMLTWACEHAPPRLSTGLVEQQRYFMKLRKPGTTEQAKRSVIYESPV
ncbi:MAG: hypothetical protein JRH18_19330 [Deltaproteobacteria bacterium]|nr:hypothetical protein [Deltaproteobacteria bacterium]MBW2153805.1 hypothetical protein [Deltaproteobacteria bacterium]